MKLLKLIFTTLLIIGVSSTSIYAQCGGSQDPNDVDADRNCADAPLITTNGTYSGNTNDFNPPVSNPTTYWLAQSGFTIENIGFYKFEAAASTLEFTV